MGVISRGDAQFFSKIVGVDRDVSGCDLCFWVFLAHVLDASLVKRLAFEDLEDFAVLLEGFCLLSGVGDVVMS